jgi:hypothetical protein
MINIRWRALLAAFAMLAPAMLDTAGDGAVAPPPSGAAVVRAVVSQLRQYSELKTIHFLARGNYKMVVPNRTIHFTERYAFWGAGTKFRIDFQQFRPGASFDVLITDNGRRYRYFDRIGDELRVMRSHPRHGETPDMRNPILEPLIFLIPRKARWHWLNLARLAGNPQSVLTLCLAIKRFVTGGMPGAALGGFTSGSLAGKPTRFTFYLSSGVRDLVSRVAAREVSGHGLLQLHAIKYKAFHTKAGRVLLLPTAFQENGRQGPARFAMTMNISDISVDRPIPPSRFTIDYKLARVVVDETAGGKWKYITVQPAHPAPGGTRILK